VGAANPYCSFVVQPKVAKFRQHFLDRLKKRA
jgi:peptide-methionine (S)-S-oxide reductase